MTALIVQQDPNARNVWRAALMDRGHRVIETASSELAQAQLGEDVDLVLVDLCLGLRSGLTLARSAERTRPDCCFILLTGAAQHDRTRVARRAPARSILLCKPVDIERISGELDALTDLCLSQPPI